MVFTRGSIAKAQNPKRLDGYEFAISGTHPSFTQQKIKDLIREKGGKVTDSIKNNTYLLSTPAAFEEKTQKVGKALSMGCRIIDSSKWVKTDGCDPSRMTYLRKPPAQANGDVGEGLLPEPVVQAVNRTQPEIAPSNSTRQLIARILDLNESSLNRLITEEETWLRQANTIMKRIDCHGRKCGSAHIEKMRPLDRSSRVFKYLEGYLNASSGTAQKFTYKVNNIFDVERHPERERFQVHIKDQENPLRRLLWHGSPLRDYGRILGEGLGIVPIKVPVLSHNFVDGIHLFETSQQAAKYCDHEKHGGEALLLLCEAALGYPLNNVTKASDSNINDTLRNTTRYHGKLAFRRFIDGHKINETLKGIKLPGTVEDQGNIAVELKPTKVSEASLDYPVYICGNPDQVVLRYLLLVNISRRSN
ncbi:poly [Fusarium langsethiae]|uniref:Poly [ADP-ribose] polymerase n=1 Tax=Fusarium langsethiae TaxID=179993 RepID=A0A0M9ENZ4_FUSLA|nr:poly [Fusarium langsethiae]